MLFPQLAGFNIKGELGENMALPFCRVGPGGPLADGIDGCHI